MDSTGTNSPRAGRAAALTFLALGVSAITFAGLFSAATARSATYHSAWLVAYLVLIVGLAQVALGIGQWWLAAKPTGSPTVFVELLFFNVGHGGVIVGTLIAAPVWVYTGSIWLVVALFFFGWQVRSPRRRGVALWAYWALLVLLVVSVLIGAYFAYAASS